MKRNWLLALLLSLEMGGGLAWADGLKCNGPLWDLRYGEAVIGERGVAYTAATKAYINGRPYNMGALEKAEQLRRLRGCAAFGICDEQGHLIRLDVVAPQEPEKVGPIWEVTTEKSLARKGETLEFVLRAPTGGQAEFTVLGAEGTVVAREVSPGVYRGLYRTAAQDVRCARLLGRWKKDGREFERLGPEITMVATLPKIERVEACRRDGIVAVSALFSSEATSINPEKIHFWIDNREVTSLTVRTGKALYGEFPGEDISDTAVFCLKISDECGQTSKRYWKLP